MEQFLWEVLRLKCEQMRYENVLNAGVLHAETGKKKDAAVTGHRKWRISQYKASEIGEPRISEIRTLHAESKIVKRPRHSPATILSFASYPLTTSFLYAIAVLIFNVFNKKKK